MILVTGSNGLVGSHLITQLLSKGNQVKALYHNNCGVVSHPNLTWVQGDILDVVQLEEIFEGITQVYHCAAVVSFNPKEKQLLHKTNVNGTANVVNACLNCGVSKLLFVSSVAAIGRAQINEPIHEAIRWVDSNNNSEYSKSKYLAEMEVWRGIGEGLNAVIINPSIILGCSDWTKGSAAIFKNAYSQFPWYTEGVNGIVDVLDVVNAMIQLMESDISAERFIVSGQNSSYKAIFSQVAMGFGKKPPQKRVTPLLAEIAWRLEAMKAFFTGNNPLLTKETARTAQAKVYYNNDKLLKHFPNFAYRTLENSIERICKEFTKAYNL